MNQENFKIYLNAIRRSLVSAPGQFLSPSEGLFPGRLIQTILFKIQTYIDEPNFFKPCGTLVFCGSQGEGKTLTAVSYIKKVLKKYPHAILVTNTRIRGRPVNAYIHHEKIPEKKLKEMYEEVVEDRKKAFYEDAIAEIKEEFYEIKAPTMTVQEYIRRHIQAYFFNETDDFAAFRQEKEYQLRDIFSDELVSPQSILSGRHKNVTVMYSGLDCLKYVSNGKLGVLFFIDEIHLELNSLESKNVPVEVMVEISQQRKQRKHIIGTSQRYNRMAKPLREQIRNCVACRCFFGAIQYNQLIDGDSAVETSEGIKYDVRRRMLWFHAPEMYKSYDTYAKMVRYNNEWQGRPQILALKGDLFNE